MTPDDLKKLREKAERARDSRPQWYEFHNFVGSFLAPTEAEFVVDVSPSTVVALLDKLEAAQAKAAVIGGEACLEERARGNGPCGACAVCCAEIRQQLSAAQAEVERLRSDGACGDAAGRVISDAYAEVRADRERLKEQLTAAQAENTLLLKREPTRHEMEFELGARNEIPPEHSYPPGWPTIRRCRMCGTPVPGGPTLCVGCSGVERARSEVTAEYASLEESESHRDAPAPAELHVSIGSHDMNLCVPCARNALGFMIAAKFVTELANRGFRICQLDETNGTYLSPTEWNPLDDKHARKVVEYLLVALEGAA
jgi:hypothetical protein